MERMVGLRDAFDGDEQVIATWLTSYIRPLGSSPLERLAERGPNTNGDKG
ncbi:hypothetical protein [Candidatus Propionivibrio aalborgensis]|nr:hypothetical protein [Candidatus Propionivibrio aalborgensis]